MKKLYISSILAAALMSTLNANSLKETVTQTIMTNSEIISNQLKIKSAQKDIEVEEGGYYPTLDLEAYAQKGQTKDRRKGQAKEAWAKEEGGRATLKASQLLYNGWNTQSKVKEKEHNYLEKTYRYTQENENIVFDIIEAYNDLVKYNELKQVMGYSQKAHNEALEVAYDKEEISGEALETLKTLNLISIQEDKKLALDNDINKARSKYRSLTSMDKVGNICRPVIDKRLIPNTLEETIKVALENNYKIKEQKEIVKKQKEILSQEDSNFHPDIRLNLSAAYDKDLELNDNGVQKEYIGQVMLNWNFYNGGKDDKRYDKERIRLNEENKNLEKITNDVIENITNLYYTYEKTKSRIENFEKSIKSNEEILALTKDQLEDGTKTFIDVLQIKSKLLDSQTNKIRQEFVLINTYYKILTELSIVTKTVMNSYDQVCLNEKVQDLTNENKPAQEENLDDLLDADSSINSEADSKESLNEVLEEEQTVVEEEQVTVVEKANFVDQISESFSTNKNVNFDKDNLSITIRTTPESFRKGKLNPNSNFTYKLDSFSSEFMETLDKNKDSIRAIHLEAYTSSEYRSVEGLENKFKANLRASKKRANELKEYFRKQAIDEKLDTKWFDENIVAVGKGSLNLIKDANGVEDKEASRRVIIKIIKR